MTDPTHYEFYYYNSRGFAEPIRMILAYSGVSFNDNRTPITSFSPITPLPDDWKARSPFGQVPILEFDGKRLTQHQAITRYLARTYDLVGKDEFESARCDEIGDGIKDFFISWFDFYYQPDPERKLQAVKTATETAHTRYLPVLNSMVETNDGVHLVGDKITWPDIYLTHVLDHLPRITGVELVKDYSGLQALMKNVLSTPGIKQWMEQRPNTPF